MTKKPSDKAERKVAELESCEVPAERLSINCSCGGQIRGPFVC